MGRASVEVDAVSLLHQERRVVLHVKVDRAPDDHEELLARVAAHHRRARRHIEQGGGHLLGRDLFRQELVASMRRLQRCAFPGADHAATPAGKAVTRFRQERGDRDRQTGGNLLQDGEGG